jgi:oxygen-independent coproporphyrinogen-3 oxidase
VDEIKSLIDEILKYFDFEKNIEITLEANPDDLAKNF